jgi:hypothetical protein
MYADTTLANAAAARLTMYAAHQLQAVFRYEMFVFHAGKLRLLDHLSRQRGRVEPTEKQRKDQARFTELAGRCFGSVPFIEFLKTQFAGPEDQLDVPECWPTFEITADAEVRRITAIGAHQGST